MLTLAQFFSPRAERMALGIHIRLIRRIRNQKWGPYFYWLRIFLILLIFENPGPAPCAMSWRSGFAEGRIILLAELEFLSADLGLQSAGLDFQSAGLNCQTRWRVEEIKQLTLPCFLKTFPRRWTVLNGLKIKPFNHISTDFQLLSILRWRVETFFEGFKIRI